MDTTQKYPPQKDRFMKEELLHYAWRMRRFHHHDLRTTDGQSVDILHPGQHNPDAGPDFLNARLRVGDTLWAGNVEMHLRSSDWLQHRHQEDLAYDNVILHVVFEDDQPIARTTGSLIPCLEMKNRISRRLAAHYQRLLHNESWVPCAEALPTVNELTRHLWLDRLAAERLEQKAGLMTKRLTQNQEDWEATFYQFLARSFGSKVNGDPMEMLAQQTPLLLLKKYRHSLFQMEALLFGQSGLLEQQDWTDEYPRRLLQEYRFLQKKHGLRPIPLQAWKFMRLRPANFPTIRIAQLAALLYQTASLFSKVMSAQDVKELENVFEVKLSNYWWEHYTFDNASRRQQKALGQSTVHLIIINTIVPFLFLYGKRKGDARMQDKALNVLEDLRPEQNRIIRGWKKVGMNAQSAYQSQALLQLKSAYCDQRRCLECAIGNALLKEEGLAEEPWPGAVIGEDWEQDWGALFSLPQSVVPAKAASFC